MPPIRRYLRITRYSVLETRIYLDQPSLAETWLLNPRNPILPRVIAAVRPLVLPKLREERELYNPYNPKTRNKKRKKRVRDVVVEPDFEVSIFLTPTTTRHSLLTKHKHFKDPNDPGQQSSQRKITDFQDLTGDTAGDAIEVEDGQDNPVIREEEDDDDGEGGNRIDLSKIPEAVIPEEEQDISISKVQPRTRRRKRAQTDDEDEDEDEDEISASDVEADSDEDEDGGRDEDALFVPEDSHPPSKRRRRGDPEAAPPHAQDEAERGDDKKKLALTTFYDGFALYGSVLCLVVKRRDGISTSNSTSASGAGRAGASRTANTNGKGKGKATANGKAKERDVAHVGTNMMEEWITSTQIQRAQEEEGLELELDDEDEVALGGD